jgi:excisionase family DNA binding protein
MSDHFHASPWCTVKIPIEEVDLTHITETLSNKQLFLKVREVSELLGVSPTTVYRLLDKGDLEKVSISLSTESRKTRITSESVSKLIRQWTDFEPMVHE